MEPIKINVEDNFKYTQIAFLVDRDNFLEDVIEYRKKWLKTDKPFLTKSFEEWFNTLKEPGKTRDFLLGQNAAIKRKSLLAKGLIQQRKRDEAKRVTSELQILFRELPNLDFKGDIETSLVRYKVPSTCYKTIARAIISNEIRDSDWQFYDVVLKPPDLEPEQILPSRNRIEPVCELTITPYISRKDWDYIYRTNIEKIKVLYQNSPFGYKVYGKDTISNIKRDRKWYWANKNGISYNDIWIKLENSLGTSNDYIAKAIQQYKKNLNS